MKQTIQRFAALTLALVLCLSLPVSAAEASSRVDGIAERAAGAVLDIGQVAQVSWALWQEGEIVSSGSWKAETDVSGNHLEGKGDVYCIGSVSKIFTTAAVMQLVEQGKVDLDKPVTTYLPSFKMADPRYKDITVRMLLNHSSGIMGSSLSNALLLGDANTRATDHLLQQLSTQRLKADPGAYSVYCNDGFTLAELVVEAVTDMNFVDYLHENIFDPAGLKETWSPEDNFESRRVDIYQTGFEKPLPKECLGVIGAGGLYATAEDLARFGGALTDSTLLKKSSRDAMAVPECEKGLWPGENYPSALTFGLGWDSVEWYPFHQNDITALMKGGDTGYYHAGLVVLPEKKMAAAVLSSGGASPYNEMAASQILIAALENKGQEVAQIRFRLPGANRAALPKELADAAGYYGGQLVYQVELAEDGTMTMRFTDMPELPDRTYAYYDDGTFRNEGGTTAFRLVKEKNGQTYLYQWSFSNISGLGNLPTSTYAAMKLPENPVSPELQAGWEKRMSEAAFLPVTDRYSSQTYLALGPGLKELAELKDKGETPAVSNAPGYAGNLQIVDETHARYVIQVPGNAGRDGYDLEIRPDEKGILWEYMSNGTAGIDMAGVPDISTGKNGAVSCTIQPNGYARWYKAGDAAAGKTMAVQVPQEAGFWVYSAGGTVKASSHLWDSASVKLAKGDLIVFAGNPGAQFKLTFS